MQLLGPGKPDIAIEAAPQVAVGSRRRKSGFRVRSEGEPWTGMRNERRSRIPALRSAPFRGSGLLRLQGVRLGSWPRCGRALLAADPPKVIAGVGSGNGCEPSG